MRTTVTAGVHVSIVNLSELQLSLRLMTWVVGPNTKLVSGQNNSHLRRDIDLRMEMLVKGADPSSSHHDRCQAMNSVLVFLSVLYGQLKQTQTPSDVSRAISNSDHELHSIWAQRHLTTQITPVFVQSLRSGFSLGLLRRTLTTTEHITPASTWLTVNASISSRIRDCMLFCETNFKRNHLNKQVCNLYDNQQKECECSSKVLALLICHTASAMDVDNMSMVRAKGEDS